METINHEYYVSLEVAKLLKETGFDWEVNTCRYNSSPDKISSNGTLTSNFNGYAFQHIAISAPTLEVAQRWLREVKMHHIFVSFLFANNHKYYVFLSRPSEKGNLECECGWIENEFNTYEEAQEAGIKKALEIILKEKK